MSNQVKQVIVIRKDLKVRRGKEIAQGAHASISFLVDQVKKNKIHLSAAEKQWINTNFAKICLQVESEEELINVYESAIKAGLKAFLITDSGLTEFNGIPTRTYIAIGPDWSDAIDSVTKHLKLY